MSEFDTTAPVRTSAAGLGSVRVEPESRSATAKSQAKRRPRRRRLGPGKRIPYGALIGPGVLLLLWAVLSAASLLDYRIVPAPWTVASTGYDLWVNGSLRGDIMASLGRAAQGWALGLTIGLALAFMSGLSRVGEALIDGPVQINRGVPNLGLIPLFILWLGLGESFKIAIITLGVMVPIYINTHAALTSIDVRYVELAESVRLNRWQFLRHIVIPGAMPGFFVGLRLSVVGAWLSLIVLEQINATSGLGYLMFRAGNYGLTDVIFVVLLIYAIYGFTSNEIVRAIERKVLSWQRTLSS